MPQPLTEKEIIERHERFLKLPPSLQEAMFSEAITKKINGIAVKHNLVNQVGEMANAIGEVFLGILHPNLFIRTFAERSQISVDKARAVSLEVSAAIFAPVRNELLRLYKITPQSPKAPGVSQKPTAPFSPASPTRTAPPVQSKSFSPALPTISAPAPPPHPPLPAMPTAPSWGKPPAPPPTAGGPPSPSPTSGLRPDSQGAPSARTPLGPQKPTPPLFGSGTFSPQPPASPLRPERIPPSPPPPPAGGLPPENPALKGNTVDLRNPPTP